MADGTEITSLSHTSEPKTAEFLAFVDGLAGLTCRQREALVEIMQQIVRLESKGDQDAIARLLLDAPALLKLSSDPS